MSEPGLLVIAGPTGVGKSALAVRVARHLDAEIVSADSRQLYRGMNIGTATPTMDEREGVHHHLLDVLDPDVRVNAGWFMGVARDAVSDINSRGRSVVVVGGSTLYVHALLEGLAPLPSLPSELESELSERIQTVDGREQMMDELRSADPAAAATLDATKSHRLVRLLGIIRVTGRPVSEVWAEHKSAPFRGDLVVLDRPRDSLYQRIENRVGHMINNGLLNEVASVLSRWPESRPTLEATIGYRELLPVLSGEQTQAEAQVLIQRNSRRYAKRQLTWYRRYPDARWLDAAHATVADVLGSPL